MVGCFTEPNPQFVSTIPCNPGDVSCSTYSLYTYSSESVHFKLKIDGVKELGMNLQFLCQLDTFVGGISTASEGVQNGVCELDDGDNAAKGSKSKRRLWPSAGDVVVEGVKKNNAQESRSQGARVSGAVLCSERPQSTRLLYFKYISVSCTVLVCCA